jgi:hypothetical protein
MMLTPPVPIDVVRTGYVAELGRGLAL